MIVASPARYSQSSSLVSARLLDRAAYLLMCGFLIAIPWDELSQLGGYAIARYLGLASFGLTVLRIGAAGHVRKLSYLHALMLGFAGLSVLSLLWTVDPEATAERVGTYSQLLLLVWLIWESAPTSDRVTGLLQSYVLGNVVAASLTLHNFTQGTTAGQLSALQGEEGWDESRFSITGINENDLGLMLAMALPMMMYLAVHLERKAARLMCWLVFVICLVATLLTGSRGALGSLLVACVMLPLTIRKLPAGQKAIAVCACVAAVALGIALIPQNIWNRLFALSSELSEGTLTHRTVIWAAGWSVFRDHAFLGVGSGAHAFAVLPIVDIAYVAHNTFFSVLVELGVCGFLVFAGLLASMVFCVSSLRYLEKCLWFTVLATWSVGVMALTWEYRKPTWVMFGLLAAHVYSRRGTSVRWPSPDGGRHLKYAGIGNADFQPVPSPISMAEARIHESQGR